MALRRWESTALEEQCGETLAAQAAGDVNEDPEVIKILAPSEPLDVSSLGEYYGACLVTEVQVAQRRCCQRHLEGIGEFGDELKGRGLMLAQRTQEPCW